VEGFYKTRNGLDQAISRGLAYAPYAALIWCETGQPDLEFARKFADAIPACQRPSGSPSRVAVKPTQADGRSPDRPSPRPSLAALGDRQAARSALNCSSSVDPLRAVVEDWPCWIAWVTASK